MTQGTVRRLEIAAALAVGMILGIAYGFLAGVSIP